MSSPRPQTAPGHDLYQLKKEILRDEANSYFSQRAGRQENPADSNKKLLLCVNSDLLKDKGEVDL